ncbi:MAG TPA: aldehyde dehydrogenase family protein [Nitrososphaerales archaeon]|nr:aldehyde dehydrogenase family protein [Nitrososphaerales archaeon]
MIFKQFIDGEFVDSSTGEEYAVTNPANGTVVDRVARGTVEDARAAIDHASDALKRERTAKTNISRILQVVSDLIRAHETELATLMTLEQGKTLMESRGEIKFFAHTMEYYAGLKARGSQVQISDATKLAVVEKEPVGVVGAIVPWNNPILLMGAKVAASLAAGNAIVVKPASTTPLSTIKSMELFKEAGLPKGLLNVVTGSGPTVGEELVKNPKTRKVSFTGETATGKRIMELASAQLKRVTLELGGSNPLIVCDDADLDAAVNATLNGRFRNAGQGCMCVKRTYVFESLASKFLSKLKEKALAIKVGDGMKPDTTMGPVHSRSQRSKVELQVNETVSGGATLLLGGNEPTDPDLGKGSFYMPTLVTNVAEESRLVSEECFGPALPIITVEGITEAIEGANSSIYGLGASIWTKDLATAKKAASELEAGTVLVNSLYGAGGWEIEVPMGGYKQSGIGREYGIEGLESYTETKTIIFGS